MNLINEFNKFNIEYTYNFSCAYRNEINECVVNNFDIQKMFLTVKNETTKHHINTKPELVFRELTN